MAYPFGPLLALDESGQPVRSGTGQVYSNEDTEFTTPLAVTTFSGIPKADISINAFGIVEAFMADEPEVMWKSGEFIVSLTSGQGLREMAAASATLAGIAASAAEEAALIAQQVQEAIGAGAIARTATVETAPEHPVLFDRDLTYDVDSESPNLAELTISSVLKMWMNEWGALRGTSPYSWGDALVRAIREDADGITAGRAYELVDRRTGSPEGVAGVMWGIRWADGVTIRNGLAMADVLVLAPGETEVPEGTPPGTVILQAGA